MTGNITLDVPRLRFVIAHYHIFKNGGTTIESILGREFGPGFATVHGPADYSILHGEHLAAFLGEHPEVSAISSHHLRFPRPAIPGMVIFDCCFLRHPLDRLISVYCYFKGIESSDRLCQRARRHTARDFVLETLDESPHLVSDVQVTQLANEGAFRRPVNERDLDRATQVFCDMAVPGIVDMFSESLVAAEYFLVPSFPGIRLHYTPHNVSRTAGTRHSARAHRPEDQLAEFWGEGLYADLTRLNQYDLELYSRAKSEIRRRLFLVPNLDDRFADFHARCAGLPPASSEMAAVRRLEGQSFKVLAERSAEVMSLESELDGGL